MQKDIQKELDRTKVALMQTKEAVFFTTIVFSLKFRWDDTIPTASTNGHDLRMNPDFFLKASKAQRVFVLVHEANHVAYDHMGRLGKRDMALWNKAADHVINLMLKARGFEMWDWVLCDPRFTDMSTEQVYKILEAEKCQQPNPMQDIELPSLPGDGNAKPIPMDPAAHQRHIENILIRASTQARMAGQPGSVPGEVELFLQNLLRPRLPWQQILRREVGQTAKNAYSWNKPNRRFMPHMYLPSLHSQAPAELTCYVDISGSVSDEQFHIFVSEMAGALRMFHLTKLRIVQFDTAIKHDDTVNSLAALKNIKFTGRGGTWIEPVFEHIEKHKPKLSAIFTDGGFDMPDTHPKSRILWLINDNPDWTADFGAVTHFNTD